MKMFMLQRQGVTKKEYCSFSKMKVGRIARELNRQVTWVGVIQTNLKNLSGRFPPRPLLHILRVSGRQPILCCFCISQLALWLVAQCLLACCCIINLQGGKNETQPITYLRIYCSGIVDEQWNRFFTNLRRKQRKNTPRLKRV